MYAENVSAAQAEDLIFACTVATFSEELANCFEDATHKPVLDQLQKACCKAAQTIKLMLACQTSKERACWSALSSLSQSVRKALTALPDGDELLDQMCEPLNHKSSFQESLRFARGMHTTSKDTFLGNGFVQC